MALLSGRSFSLNPNAPVFIPFALRNVEDFSPEWWELVKTSPWFRDYWLSQHQVDDFHSTIDDDLGDAEEFLDLEEAEFEDMIQSIEGDEKPVPEAGQSVVKNIIKSSEMDAKKVLKDLAIPKSPKNRGTKSPVGSSKYKVKPAKCMSPKLTPKFIHQPR